MRKIYLLIITLVSVFVVNSQTIEKVEGYYFLAFGDTKK